MMSSKWGRSRNANAITMNRGRKTLTFKIKKKGITCKFLCNNAHYNKGKYGDNNNVELHFLGFFGSCSFNSIKRKLNNVVFFLWIDIKSIIEKRKRRESFWLLSYLFIKYFGKYITLWGFICARLGAKLFTLYIVVINYNKGNAHCLYATTNKHFL